ncbi:MAG TPA: DNA methyltransferase [Pirellulales bacterium]|nr:DNA methyltransferase [Pirellulales bacterium]
MPPHQKTLFDWAPATKRAQRSGTFVDNMQLPVHRWFRYSAGFSAEWVRNLIRSAAMDGGRVLDPFAGSGTVVLESEQANAESIGLEAHPFLARIARAKLGWREPPEALRRRAKQILTTTESTNHGKVAGYPPLIRKCFPDETLGKLDSLKHAMEALSGADPLSELVWLALVAILRSCSPVGTAQWQYVLPRKSKARSSDPWEAFERQADGMAHDMAVMQQRAVRRPGTIHLDDARHCSTVADGWADLVITSPPYANNYDYADATRLEMCFFGEIARWGDLQSAVREKLVRACTQHVASYADRTQEVIESETLRPIRGELTEVCAKLQAERENHGGKKPYHAMIAHYFLDLSQVWIALRRVTKRGGKVCFVIGDSAPYGVHVPVETWLGELAIAAGFRGYVFEKLRDRNTKWKNRKHRVPLQEGRLWVDA